MHAARGLEPDTMPLCGTPLPQTLPSYISLGALEREMTAAAACPGSLAAAQARCTPVSVAGASGAARKRAEGPKLHIFQPLQLPHARVLASHCCLPHSHTACRVSLLWRRPARNRSSASGTLRSPPAFPKSSSNRLKHLKRYLLVEHSVERATCGQLGRRLA